MKMNTSYEELDADIESQLPAESVESERCKYCKFGVESCIKKDIPKCLKWSTAWVLFMFMIWCIVSYVVELLECDPDGNCHYDEQHDYYLKKNYKTEHRRLTYAGVIHNRRIHRHTCDDYEFGCCEIYTECEYNQTNITDYHTYTFHGLPKHNKNGTNCPRLHDLVNGHNHHFPLDDGVNCEESEYGCYKIETECDIRVRFMNMEGDSELYKRNVHAGHKYTYLVERVGIDWKPSILKLMNEYRNKYVDTDEILGDVGIVVVVALLFFALVTNK